MPVKVDVPETEGEVEDDELGNKIIERRRPETEGELHPKSITPSIRLAYFFDIYCFL